MIYFLKNIILKLATFIKDEWNVYGSLVIAYLISWFMEWNMNKMQTANQFIVLVMNLFILLTVIKRLVFPNKKHKLDDIANVNKQFKTIDLSLDTEQKINETTEMAIHIMEGGNKLMKKLKDFFKLVWGNKVTLASTIYIVAIAIWTQVVTYTDKLYCINWFAEHEIIVKIASPILTALLTFVSLYGTYTRYGLEGLQTLADRKLSTLSKEEKKALKEQLSKLEKAYSVVKNKFEETQKVIDDFKLLIESGYTLNSNENSTYNMSITSLATLTNTIEKLEKEINEVKEKL